MHVLPRKPTFGQFVLILIMIFVFTQLGRRSESRPVNTAPSPRTSESDRAPRYRLADDYQRELRNRLRTAVTAPRDENVTASDFTWEALTKGGPASGANPIIGDRTVSAYYDFKDGQPLPYFVAKQAPVSHH